MCKSVRAYPTFTSLVCSNRNYLLPRKDTLDSCVRDTYTLPRFNSSARRTTRPAPIDWTQSGTSATRGQRRQMQMHAKLCGAIM